MKSDDIFKVAKKWQKWFKKLPKNISSNCPETTKKIPNKNDVKSFHLDCENLIISNVLKFKY